MLCGGEFALGQLEMVKKTIIYAASPQLNKKTHMVKNGLTASSGKL
jgi:hypothetical protein